MSLLENIKPDHVVDARGVSCPGPILEAKKGMAKLKVNQIMEVKAADEGTKVDLPIWVKRVGHEFLGIVEREGYASLFIRRKK